MAKYPAEFPNISPVYAHVTPEGEIGGQRATAEDFGSAQGLEGLARGIGQVGEAASNIADDQARTWAATASAQQEVNVRKAWQDKVNNLDPTAQDYPEQIANLTGDATQAWDQAADDVQEKAPNGYASKLLGAHFADAKARFQLEAMNQQASLNAGYTSDLVKQGISADADLVSASPDNDTYFKAATRWTATIGGYKTVDPEAKAKLSDYVLNVLANAQAHGAVERGGFLASISPDGGITVTPAPDQAVSSVAVGKDGKASSALVAAVTNVESQGNAGAVSPKGAIGAMQVMPATASTVAAAAGIDYAGPQDLTDPVKDTAIGTAYLNQQLAAFKDPRLALAAYNAGPGAVSALTAKYGTSYAAIAPHLPAETQAYVPQVLARMGVGDSEPQVKPVPEEAIATAKPPLAGWDNLTWPEKVGYVRQAEAQLGKALSEQRGQLRSGLEDSIASFKNGVTPPDANNPMYSRGNMVAVLGADEGNRAYTEYSFAKQVAGNIQQIATMPLAQRSQLVATTRASAAGVGADANFQMANAMAQANAQVSAQIKADPINYAIQTHINGEAPLDMSSDAAMVKGLARRQQTNRIMTGEQGAAPAIFTTQEQQQISGHIASLPPAARVDFLVNMRRGLTDDRAYQTAMNQIAGAHSNLAYAGNIAVHLGTVPSGNAQQSGLDVARQVAEGDVLLNGGAYTGEKKAGQPGSDDPALPKGRTASPFSMTDFSKAFNAAVAPAAFQSGGAGYSQRVYSDTMNATAAYFAAWARHNGVDVSDFTRSDVQAGVKQAVSAVTGGVWNAAPNHGVLFAPWGTPMQQFQDQWDGRAQAAFKGAGYDDQQTKQWIGNATPVNVGDGRYQFMYRGVTVNRPGTQVPVTVNYGDPLPQVQQPAPPAVDGIGQALRLSAGRGA